MDYYQDESIDGWWLKTERERTSAAMPGTFLYWPNPPDVVGAITPVASEVISLLLVRILHILIFDRNFWDRMFHLCKQSNYWKTSDAWVNHKLKECVGVMKGYIHRYPHQRWSVTVSQLEPQPSQDRSRPRCHPGEVLAYSRPQLRTSHWRRQKKC